MPITVTDRDLIKTIRTALSSYREELARKIDTRSAELEESIKTLKDARIARSLQSIPTAAELLRSIESSIKSEEAGLEDARRFVRAELDRLDEDLKKLQSE